ncbi:FKBP-type peptidyl-prolyl cis-trans isomerase [Actinocorallia sp. B10E7]|uniref:FKBP-type peptidyl-prolyl cis-trans isomerase n=1 Tax=Actinocorallia sp. B10E7 TaxID=3153558 RepID=UPI00325E4D84
MKLPSARDISRTDFTPHGINKGRGSLRRPANKAELRKKRIKQTGVAVLVLAIIAGVAGGAYMLTRPEENFTITGAFNKDPKITFPEVKPYSTSRVERLIKGDGEKLQNGDTAYVNFETYQWTGAKKFEEKSSSYSGDGPTALPVGAQGGSGFKKLDEAMNGATLGSRYLVTMPVKELGETGDQTGLKPSDNVIFVVDVVTKQYKISGDMAAQDDDKLPKVTAPKKDGEAPGIELPDADAPKELTVKTLIEGSGPVVVKGQKLAAHYKGVIWDGGKEFDSSYATGEPASFEIGTGAVIPGWDKALVGLKAGSRVLLVIPPADGYGEKGNESAKIKGDDTLVFVVDVLTSY